jgi:hypothetical protein
MLDSFQLTLAQRGVDLGDYVYLILIVLAVLGELARRIVDFVRGKPAEPPKGETPKQDAPPPVLSQREAPPIARPAPPSGLRVEPPTGLPRPQAPRLEPAPRPLPPTPRPIRTPDAPVRPAPPTTLQPVRARRPESLPTPRRSRKRAREMEPPETAVAVAAVEPETEEILEAVIVPTAAPARRTAAMSRVARLLGSRSGALAAVQFAEILSPPVALRERHLP